MWNLVHDDDLPLIASSWQQISIEKTPVHIQYRLKRLWNNGDDGPISHVWVDCTALPELDKDGKLHRIILTLTEISHFKWAEAIQKIRLEEAVEAKRQQEK